MSKTIPSTLLSSGGGLYAAEAKVYPREIRGRFDRMRRLAVLILLGWYYLAPWLSWDGRQAVLLDLPARKFYVLGLVFWPQDFIFLALLLIIAGISLFFFTTVAGRLWCGYACPQTVWTEVFLWIEHATEGDRNKRMKLDAGPWTAEKWRRKGAKHLLWLALGLWTGFTFVGFFTPIQDLGARLVPFAWSGWESFWVLFYALATWGNAGFLREQVCKYMCPYARFQGAMFDRDTLLIAYDPLRGEPRGSRKRGIVPASLELGDCIDCTLCVQVCPTGIDIRNGLQYECIACGACIDACDSVMDKMNYPRGLIRYSTQNAVEGQPGRVLRPRVLIYGVLLLSLVGGWAWGVSHRAPLLAELLRDRNALYRVAGDGRIENAYTLKLVNKAGVLRRFRVRLENAGPVLLSPTELEVAVAAEALATLPLTLHAPAGSVHGRAALQLVVEAIDEPSVARTVDTAFFAPIAGGAQ